jgi:hypothetical protein
MDSGSSSKERTGEEHDVVELKKALATGAASKEQPVAPAAGAYNLLAARSTPTVWQSPLLSVTVSRRY